MHCRISWSHTICMHLYNQSTENAILLLLKRFTSTLTMFYWVITLLDKCSSTFLLHNTAATHASQETCRYGAGFWFILLGFGTYYKQDTICQIKLVWGSCLQQWCTTRNSDCPIFFIIYTSDSCTSRSDCPRPTVNLLIKILELVLFATMMTLHTGTWWMILLILDSNYLQLNMNNTKQMIIDFILCPAYNRLTQCLPLLKTLKSSILRGLNI